MPNAEFPYDLFLSHSAKDKAVVRPQAERLRKDGRIDKLSTLDSQPACAAVHRDPANAGRRFIPLLLGDCALPDTLGRCKVVDFREESAASIAEGRDQMIHFNGERFFGPYPDVRPTKP